MTATEPHKRFVDYLRVEKVGGLVLLVAAALALAAANSPLAGTYEHVREFHFGPSVLAADLSAEEWAADGLLAVFFYVVGLEVKRELTVGELTDRKAAALPVTAAVGGIVVPALLYLAIAGGVPGASRGWAIPTATDIAFALGVLAVAGAAAPVSLRIFLLSLAVIDDLGAIAIIAVVYTDQLHLLQLAGAALLLAVYWALQQRRVTSAWLYVPLAVAVWLLVHASGIHATVAGVALGLLTRTRTDPGEAHSPAERLEHRLQPWSAGVAVPLFAFLAAGVTVAGDTANQLITDRVAVGIIVGLVLGKTVGVLGGAWLAVQLRIASLPRGVGWADVLAIAVLAGTGFTVSLLISSLALDAEQAQLATLAVLVGSLIASLAGAVLLGARRRVHQAEPDAY
jgi:NhaA family Na+:H+ antiporter